MSARLDRTGQVWEISNSSNAEDMGNTFGGLFGWFANPKKWMTFAVISTSINGYETIGGVTRNYVCHQVLISETGVITNLNEDIDIPWEKSHECYRRVA
jgi:hypothetical protein